MKLRIRDNSVRFRLTQPEVAALARGESVGQATQFTPAQRLSCDIVPVPDSTVRVTFAGERLVLMLPTTAIATWAETSRVGIRLDQHVDEHATLSIVVEKDFACLHGEEKTAGAFPNPHAPADGFCVAELAVAV